MTAGSRWEHRTIEVEGPRGSGPVHVLDFGGPTEASGSTDTTAAPLVLVHGLDGSAANWVDVGPELARHRRVVAIDLPGFGRTPLAGRSPRMTPSADLALDAAAQLVDGPVHLVGSSMGGVVVLQAAARHPDAVARVSLIAPAVPRAGRGPIAWSFVPWVLPFWMGVGSAESHRRMRQDPEARVAGLLRLCYAPGSTTSPVAFAEMVEVAAARSRRDAVSAWTGAARDLFGRLANRGGFHRMAASVTCPVHMVEGVADPVIPSSSVAAAVERHGWQHTRLHGVGHAPMLEAPERTVEAILDIRPAGHATGRNDAPAGDVV